MHLTLLIRDGQKKIGIVEVQTFETELYVAQLAIEREGSPDTPWRILMPLNSTEIDALIAALQTARKNIRKVGS